MRILAVADTPDPVLYDDCAPQRWRGRVDLVISCGDLDRSYLEFLVTTLEVPLLYVPGNHDAAYRDQPPEGCDTIDDRIVTIDGLRIAGIGGCLNYNAGSDAYQYTEGQMARRLRRLGWRLALSGPVDLVVSHAGPRHDDPKLDLTDRAHRPCAGFRRFIGRHGPRWWLHGHNHLYDRRVPRITRIGETAVINACGHYLLDAGAPSSLGVRITSPRAG